MARAAARTPGGSAAAVATRMAASSDGDERGGERAPGGRPAPSIGARRYGWHGVLHRRRQAWLADGLLPTTQQGQSGPHPEGLPRSRPPARARALDRRSPVARNVTGPGPARYHPPGAQPDEPDLGAPGDPGARLRGRVPAPRRRREPPRRSRLRSARHRPRPGHRDPARDLARGDAAGRPRPRPGRRRPGGVAAVARAAGGCGDRRDRTHRGDALHRRRQGPGRAAPAARSRARAGGRVQLPVRPHAEQHGDLRPGGPVCLAEPHGARRAARRGRGTGRRSRSWWACRASRSASTGPATSWAAGSRGWRSSSASRRSPAHPGAGPRHRRRLPDPVRDPARDNGAQ